MIKQELSPAVFFDRDGVLIRPIPIGDAAIGERSARELSEYSLEDGVKEGMERLELQIGLPCYVITNQPDIGRGLMLESKMQQIHNFLIKDFPMIREVYVCPHEPEYGCICRKPNPGLLFKAAKEHRIDLKNSWFIGDRWVDVEAGKAASVRTILIERKFSWLPSGGNLPDNSIKADFKVNNFQQAVNHLIDRIQI